MIFFPGLLYELASLRSFIKTKRQKPQINQGFLFWLMPTAVELGLEAVKQFDAHYPELLHSAIVINCKFVLHL